jgi:ElaB/YqjD/DUF883 family membrane-anchored ribosome-binding protein
MDSATLESPAEAHALRDRAADALRHATHMSHEARLLKSMASDAVEDGVYAARRAVKNVQRRLHDAGDLRDTAVYKVKRNPLGALGVAFGAGLLFGTVAGWLLGRPCGRQD